MLEMLVLDTDHLVELDYDSIEGAALQRKLEAVGDQVATTIISAEEQSVGGWRRSIGNVIHMTKSRRINVSNGVSSFSRRGLCCRGTQMLRTSCRISVGNVFGLVRWI